MTEPATIDGGAETVREGLDRELSATLAELVDDEIRVVTLVAKRLVLGRKAYGPLDVAGDRRNWRAEAADELLDGCVYLACESIRGPRP